MSTDLVIDRVFASLTPGGAPTSVVRTGQPFFIEVETTSKDQKEFDEGRDYSLQVLVTNLTAGGTVALDATITESLGDSNWPTFPTNRFDIPSTGIVAGPISTLYSIAATVLLSGRKNPDFDTAVSGDPRVLTPVIRVLP
jgi:hypothetical protein